MIGAGLLAKKAVERGLTTQALGQDQPGPGLTGRDRLPRGLRPAAVPRASSASRPWATAAPPASATAARCRRRSRQLIDEHSLVTAAVLSGNRNFEARVHPQVRANYLASPMLVVAFALAGRVDIDLEPRAARAPARTAGRCSCATSGPRPRRSGTRWRARSSRSCSSGATARCSTATRPGRRSRCPRAAATPGIRHPPTCRSRRSSPTCLPSRRRSRDITGARVLAVLGDSVTTDHISPAGAIPKNGPAARYLREHGVEQVDWNTFGSRRGNHEVMMRGTFGNVRIKNALVPDKEGNWTLHFPTGEVISIYDAAMRYQRGRNAAGDPDGQGIRHRLEPRLGRQGPGAPGREGGHRRELRADPPEQPGGHGRAAAGLSSRAPTGSRWA